MLLAKAKVFSSMCKTDLILHKQQNMEMKLILFSSLEMLVHWFQPISPNVEDRNVNK